MNAWNEIPERLPTPDVNCVRSNQRLKAQGRIRGGMGGIEGWSLRSCKAPEMKGGELNSPLAVASEFPALGLHEEGAFVSITAY